MTKRLSTTQKWFLLGPLLWLILLIALPVIIVFKLSIAQPDIAIPPYQSLINQETMQWQGSLQSWLRLFTDQWYWKAILNSGITAMVVTILCLLIAYPMAYMIARSRSYWRVWLLGLVIFPFWTSFLIRVYAWVGILKPQGLINGLFMYVGIIDEPLILLHTQFAVVIVMVYSYLPFMILPLYSVLEKQESSLVEAAHDLGCRSWQAFLWVTLPLSKPGIMAGCLLVFIPALGEFVIPDLVGGDSQLMLGQLVWVEFFKNRDWPMAATIAGLLLLAFLLPLMYWQRVGKAQSLW